MRRRECGGSAGEPIFDDGHAQIAPGGATASLTAFTYLADSIADQTSLAAAPIHSPQLGAIVLLGYGVAAAAAAALFPIRRDVT